MGEISLGLRTDTSGCFLHSGSQSCKRECWWLRRTEQKRQRSAHHRLRECKPNPKHGEYQAFCKFMCTTVFEWWLLAVLCLSVPWSTSILFFFKGCRDKCWNVGGGKKDAQLSLCLLPQVSATFFVGMENVFILWDKASMSSRFSCDSQMKTCPTMKYLPHWEKNSLKNFMLVWFGVVVFYCQNSTDLLIKHTPQLHGFGQC